MIITKTFSFFPPTMQQIQYIRHGAELFLDIPMERIYLEALQYEKSNQHKTYNFLLCLTDEEMSKMYKNLREGKPTHLGSQITLCNPIPLPHFIDSEPIRLAKNGSAVVVFELYDNLTLDYRETMYALFETDPDNPDLVLLTQLQLRDRTIYYQVKPASIREDNTE